MGRRTQIDADARDFISRILLGMVSGWTVLLFIKEVSDLNSESMGIGATALAFLAGYNTDLLFTTIERITAAILPKVGQESVQKVRS